MSFRIGAALFVAWVMKRRLDLINEAYDLTTSCPDGPRKKAGHGPCTICGESRNIRIDRHAPFLKQPLGHIAPAGIVFAPTS